MTMARFIVLILAPVFLAPAMACFTEWATYSRDQILETKGKSHCMEVVAKLGYAIDIPADWDYRVEGCNEVVFDSENNATITVRTEQATHLGPDPDVAFSRMVETLEQEAYGVSRKDATFGLPGREVELHIYSFKVIQQHGRDAVYRILTPKGSEKRGTTVLFRHFCGQTWHQVYMLNPEWSANPETQWIYVAVSDRCTNDDSHAKDMERSLHSLQFVAEGD